MAVTTFEILSDSDITSTRTLLHEAIPLTGTIVSGTYREGDTATNVKNYTHGQFQSVYDYPYLSSSANHVFDIAIGFDEGSALSSSANLSLGEKKINMYNQFSQVLLGFTGSANDVRRFERDLTLDQVDVLEEAIFLNFSRLVTKDQIKEGTVSVKLGTGSWAYPFASTGGSVKTLTDVSASSTQATTNTLGGDYGILFDDVAKDGVGMGLVFYQAGIILLATSSFNSVTDFFSASAGTSSIAQAFVSSSITASCDALRHRIQNVSFNNTTEINSTIYFCRVPNNKYNYSSNPSYLSSSVIRVKNTESDSPISYITTIGLYSPNNELLAVAKLSEPLRKDPTNELTLRVRLDY
tara:strand:- start:438 stop:1496 length:1059 start_codon:yes stop_codon:yes gene_type:complete